MVFISDDRLRKSKYKNKSHDFINCKITDDRVTVRNSKYEDRSCNFINCKITHCLNRRNKFAHDDAKYCVLHLNILVHIRNILKIAKKITDRKYSSYIIVKILCDDRIGNYIKQSECEIAHKYYDLAIDHIFVGDYNKTIICINIYLRYLERFLRKDKDIGHLRYILKLINRLY